MPALLRAHPEVEWDGAFTYTLRRGYIPGMRVDARFYASPELLPLVLSELRDSGGGGGGGGGGFLPAVRQLANVATLPGVVQVLAPCVACRRCAPPRVRERARLLARAFLARHGGDGRGGEPEGTTAAFGFDPFGFNLNIY